MKFFLKYYATYMNVQTAQAFSQSAQIDFAKSEENQKFQPDIKKYALTSLYQWANLNFQIATLDMWTMFSTGSPAAHNAAANSFVQTDASVNQA